MNHLEQWEASFTELVQRLHSEIKLTEHFTLKMGGEHSQFTRFNYAKVRQTGEVMDGWLTLTLMDQQRSSTHRLPFLSNPELDWRQIQQALTELRQEVPTLPVDPYQTLPIGSAHSREVYTGNLLPSADVVAAVLPEVAGLDFAGLYAGGTILRGYADSAGQHHWFATDSFTLDYSLFTATGKAVKDTLAGDRWHQATYAAKIEACKVQLEQLSQPAKSIPRGQYRTYFAPAAVSELVDMLSWGAISEASLQQGGSALAMLQRGEKQLSPQFHLKENFQRGSVPRFNDLGEIAPPELEVIAGGQLVNTLVSRRTAKEYQKVANGADDSETLRAPEISPGHLKANAILATLGTGLYVSNLHYLNWSDRPSGRITGMTRYACFWVENGELIAPIENLRFDESLYRFWGDQLMALTDAQEFVANVGTYECREPGGVWTPGMLVEDFTYTL